MSREEIPKEDIRYEKETNRVVIKLSDGKEIDISPQTIRDILPTLNKEEKVQDLLMMIHDIEKEELSRMSFFIQKMKDLDKGIDNARVGLSNCQKAVCVKKYSVLIKSYVDSKNALAEIRRAITLLEKMKIPIRIRIAKLGHDPDEYDECTPNKYDI